MADPGWKTDLESRLLYRDGLILVLNKPAGIAVHAPPGKAPGPEYLEHYFPQLQFGLPRPPALAHRLDRDTSGCLVLGRHPKALRKLGKLFQEGRVQKLYWAICQGVPETLSGTITHPLHKKNTREGWRMEITDATNPEGKPANTTYRVLAKTDSHSLIECRPKTGRTHQIRVHLVSLGTPIIGDSQYGDGTLDDMNSMMLHARKIVIPLSANKGPVHVTAPPPEGMEKFLTETFSTSIPLGKSPPDGSLE